MTSNHHAPYDYTRVTMAGTTSRESVTAKLGFLKSQSSVRIAGCNPAYMNGMLVTRDC